MLFNCFGSPENVTLFREEQSARSLPLALKLLDRTESLVCDDGAAACRRRVPTRSCVGGVSQHVGGDIDTSSRRFGATISRARSRPCTSTSRLGSVGP